jgi:protein-S-isoprenylcysteine O-methyltransferase Ste14
LVAFLYAIGFVDSYYVPNNINSGVPSSLYSALLVNTLLLSLFAIQHSIMARPGFKNWLTAFISPAVERSLYVLLSSLALLLLYWKWQPITSVVWNVDHEIARMILIGLYALGWLIVFLSTFMINYFELFGLQQIFNNLKNKETSNPKFQTRFFYKLVRHPIMLGFVIAFWAAPYMTLGYLMFAVVTTI